MNRGLLLAFEGIDGTGKSTQLRLLAEYLRGFGQEVIETREPTDGPWGKKIRELYVDRSCCSPEEELALFVKDRREHVEQLIAPALAKGNIVLTDRYYFSTAAYQGAAGCDPDSIFQANKFAPEPDLVLLLELPPEESVRRIEQQRGETLNAFEQLEQLRRVAQLFTSFDHACITRIDAAGDAAAVQKAVRAAVEPLLSSPQDG